MLPRRLASVAIVLLALLSPRIAAAAPFTATYTFTGSAGNQASEAVDSNPVGALFADITRGSGITAFAGANSINSVGFTTGGLDANDYYQFVATPNANIAMDLTSLAFSERRSGFGIMTFEIRTSLDGFGASIYTFVAPDDTLTRRHVVALGAAFQDLLGPVTFRFFAYSAEDGSGSWRLGVAGSPDNPLGAAANLQVSGDLSTVPEPATLLLVGIGAIGLVGTRLRRARNQR